MNGEEERLLVKVSNNLLITIPSIGDNMEQNNYKTVTEYPLTGIT